MDKICLFLIVLGLAGLAHADVFIENFDSYNPPLGGSVDLVGQGGWLEADGLGGTGAGNTILKVYQGFGITIGFASAQPTDALYIDNTGEEQASRSVGRVEAGAQIVFRTLLSSSNSKSTLWVGERMADGSVNGAALVLTMTVSSSSKYTYSMDKYPSPSPNSVTLFDDTAGRMGRWAEIRITLMESGGPGTGVDGASIEARNITNIEQGLQDADWISIGNLPLHPTGIGNDDIEIAIGGRSVSFENLIATPALPITIDFESYNTGADLIGQGGWLEAESLGGIGTGNSGMTVETGAGLGGSNGFVVGSGLDEKNTTMIVRELFAGNEVTVDFQINSGGHADVWVGERMADGTSEGAALDLKVSIGGGDVHNYTLNKFPTPTPTVVISADDSAGKQGDWTQLRLTLINTPGACDWGFDTALIEVKNLTTGGDWQFIGLFPVNTCGLGNGLVYGHELAIVLGGKDVVFDNLNIIPASFNLDNCEIIRQMGNTIASDLFADCYIDSLDLDALSLDWLNCNDPADPVNCILASPGNSTTLSIDFDTGYAPGNLIGQDGWVVGEGNSTTSAPLMDVVSGVGLSGSDALVNGTAYQHAAINIASLAHGAQISVMFQLNVNSDFAELWVGDAKHVDGIASNEVSLHLEMGRTTGDLYYYTLITDSPARVVIAGGPLGTDTGQLGDWAEVRLTLSGSGGANGIDGATVHARNITTASAWQYLGDLPLNSLGIGHDNIYVVLGGVGARMDNLNIAAPLPPADCDEVLALGLQMASDIVPDCYINILEFSVVSSDWMRCNHPDDLNCEGVTDDSTGLTRGHQRLVETGLQLGAQVSVATTGYFDTVRWAESNLTAVNFIGLPYPDTLMPSPPGVPFSNSANVPQDLLNMGYGPYMSMMRSCLIGPGEQALLTNPIHVRLLKAGFCAFRQEYPDVLVHTNHGATVFSAKILQKFMSEAEPDMLVTWKYDFSGANPGGSPTITYGGMEKHRVSALMGHDLTGVRPIPTGYYTQLWINDNFGNYSISESEMRLENFASWTFGFKMIINFIYEWRAAHLMPVIFDGLGTDNPNAKFYQLAETNRQSLNLSPALVRLISTDVRMIIGRHMVAAVPTFNDLPSYENAAGDAPIFLSTWNVSADPYITDIAATNLGSKNDSLEGDVLVGYFQPLAAEFTNVDHDNDIYFLVLNGLSDTNGTPAQTIQSIRIDFDFGSSGITSLQRLSRDTGFVETVNLTSDGSSLYHLDLVLDGGTGDLFKFNNGGTFVGP